MNISIAVHGGAGTILKSNMTPEKELSYRNSLDEALKAGWELLNKKFSSVDAVVNAVKIMEDNPLFNAGKGSVFTNEGKHKMDASLMEGKNLKAGCVASVSNIKNPIMLARKIMDTSSFVVLSGNGAEVFAEMSGLEFEPDEYFYTEFRYEQYKKALEKDSVYLDHSVIEPTDKNLDEKKFGTVGAVALDSEGNLAAATSTGGMTNVKYGRIGDSPVIGAGTYANNKTCAVSCTGDGEYFLRTLAAYDVSALMEYKNMSLLKACEEVVFNKLESIGGKGGLISVDTKGNIALVFNTEGMYRGFIDNKGKKVIDIYKE